MEAKAMTFVCHLMTLKYAVSSNVAISTSNDSFANKSCSQSMDHYVPDSRRLHCCKELQSEFERYWQRPGTSLMRYLEALKSWNCPLYNEECKNGTFRFNRFSELVYDHSCDNRKFVKTCQAIVQMTVDTDPSGNSSELQSTAYPSSYGVNNSYRREWDLIVSRLNSTFLLSHHALTKPCVQAALYEAGNRSTYQELSSVHLPTCNVVWCGFNEEVIATGQISLWTCLPQRCKASVWIIISVFVILGLVIAFVNLMVVLVFALYPSLRHGQAIYKVSLAFADLMVGLLGFPSFIYSLWMTVYRVRNVGHLAFTSNAGFFPRSFINYIGFVTNMPLAVSIYTLAAASVDRLVAVWMPLRYNKSKAKTVAKWFCLLSWILISLVSVLPMVVYSVRYTFIISLVGSLQGRNALILYSVLGAVPLLITWFASIATYYSGRRHGMIRMQLSTAAKAQAQVIEQRLAKTLLLMVSAFTLCCLPFIVVLVVAIFIPTIYPQRPRNYKPAVGTAYFSIEFATFVLVVCNSFCNFFIYNARNEKFRTSVRDMFQSAASRIRSCSCSDSFTVCCREMVHEGRRRMSTMKISTFSKNECAVDISGPVSSLPTLRSTESRRSSAVSACQSATPTHFTDQQASKPGKLWSVNVEQNGETYELDVLPSGVGSIP